MRKSVIWILLFLVIVSCSQKSEHREKIEISLVANIGIETVRTPEDEAYLFYNIRSVDCDSMGNIYVLDNKGVFVKVFDKQGRFLRKILREGRGPEEIENPYSIKINRANDHLFVLNLHGYEIKEFTPTGRYVNQYYLPQQIMFFFDFLDMERIIFVDIKSQYRFKILNLKTRKIEKSFIPLPTVPSVVYGNQRFVLKDGILWTCHNDETKLMGYDFKTQKKIAEIKIPEIYKKYTIEKTPTWWAARLRQFAQPILLNDKLYVLFTRWEWTSDKPAERKKFDVSLYRLEGNQVKKIKEIPEAKFMYLGTTWQNRLILYGNDPYPHIKVFEIKD